MTVSREHFVQSYREAFDAYLSDRDERGLNGAYELGRSAVAQQLSVLDLAAAHHEALGRCLRGDDTPASRQELIRAAGDFFLEGVSAFDVVQRALQEAREAAQLERRHAAILRRLSTFLADASLALDASGSIHEMLQLVAEHARELTDAERCAAQLNLGDGRQPIHATAFDQDDLDEVQLNELAALYRALRPPGGGLRLNNSELDRYRDRQPLVLSAAASWQPSGWLAAPLTALDGHDLGLIQVFDRHTGQFSELDEAVLVQLAQMASAAVERAQLYRLLP